MNLRELAHAQERAFLATLEDLVTRESPTRDKAAADGLASHLDNVLEEDGWLVERIGCQEVGDQLVARRPASGRSSTLLLAHYDTVWPLGTLRDMPYRRNGNQVFGPGAADMKAGIAACIHAARLAAENELKLRGPVTLLLTSDEETGSLHSRDLIERLARQHDRVLVLEPGREDGALKTGRKGTGGFEIHLRGRSAHAGNNPREGASALRELAHFLLFVEDLADDAAGTSVNLTVAGGGSATNVIAEEATAKVDVRIPTLAEAERVEQAVRSYRPRDSRVQVTIGGGINRPPMEQTPGNRALFEEAQALIRRLGSEISGAVVGGGSDGNFTSALGVPTLDGLGATGVGLHARHEHILLEETLTRLALLTALLTQPADVRAP